MPQRVRRLYSIVETAAAEEDEVEVVVAVTGEQACEPEWGKWLLETGRREGHGSRNTLRVGEESVVHSAAYLCL